MAHNIHIPWTILASHLAFKYASSKHQAETNLFLRDLPTQGKQLMHFSRVFGKALSSFSTSERAKHIPHKPIDSDNIVISDLTARRISKTVNRYRARSSHSIGRTHCGTRCNLNFKGCRCPLSLPERKLRIWIEELDCMQRHSGCCCNTRDHSDTCELLKTLILYGEVQTLLTIAAQPGVNLDAVWTLGWDCQSHFGVSELMRCCLMSYILLNVIQLHPELWDATSKGYWIAPRKKSGILLELDNLDYRNLRAWEKVVYRCTGFRAYDVHTYPHRLFFGVSEDMYFGWQCYRPGSARQDVRSSALKGHDNTHFLPSVEDIETVILLFGQFGLPTELSLQILHHADFKPQRRLPIPNDPFHTQNRKELQKYLSWCWKVLVWCDMLMCASGKKIDWTYEITNVILELWTHENSFRNFEFMPFEEEEAISSEFLALPRRRVVFT